ncbi:MAG: ATP-grasp domain-containing protein [Ignavibacteriae bacterium]|nr:ATP-grasp domain-containing protein [Ignavibacteriota bacterium]
MKVLIVYNLPSEKNAADDLDVLAQVNAVEKSLIELGHSTVKFGVDLNLEMFENFLHQYKPDFVFNLVESINGVEKYLHFIPVILEKLKIPFTGGNSESLYVTTNKVLTKKIFDLQNIPTPKWFTSKNFSNKLNFQIPCIIKPIFEDASVGLDDTSVIFENQKLNEELTNRIKNYGECFVEEFIDGREFNISIIETKKDPLVLPIAEIKFEDYPENKPKIVSYDAKWNEESFEYSHSIRYFENKETDKSLFEKLRNITIDCWEKFNLNGYARVDFRVDKNNNVYVLEINVNPCISPDSGFYAASEKFGWSYTKMVDVILNSEIK